MHTKEEVGLFLLAREDGMSVAEAAAFVGVGGGAARSWDAGMLPHSYTAGPGTRVEWGRRRPHDPRGARVGKIEIKGPYEPPETGPLAEMTPDQIEKLLLRAVSDDLKREARTPFDPDAEQVRARREIEGATGLPTSTITRFLDIPRSTYYHHLSRALGWRTPDETALRWATRCRIV